MTACYSTVYMSQLNYQGKMKRPVVVHLVARGRGREAAASCVLYFVVLGEVEVAVQGVPRQVLYREMAEVHRHQVLGPQGSCCHQSGIKTCTKSAW